MKTLIKIHTFSGVHLEVLISVRIFVFSMTKTYLCVQASLVASERVFSTAGDIVTATRSCLDPQHVDHLIFL